MQHIVHPPCVMKFLGGVTVAQLGLYTSGWS